MIFQRELIVLEGAAAEDGEVMGELEAVAGADLASPAIDIQPGKPLLQLDAVLVDEAKFPLDRSSGETTPIPDDPFRHMHDVT